MDENYYKLMTFTPTTFIEETHRARLAQLGWQSRSVKERLLAIAKLRRLLSERSQLLCEEVTRDIGRPAAEVLATDLLPFADACRFLERRAASILKPRKIPRSDTPIWLFFSRDVVHRQAWGLVGIIGTWNYPIYLNGVQIVQALVAGNAVLWKPSELAPSLAEHFCQLFADAGFPVDLLQILPSTREVGPQLLEADIDHLVFTGSDVVGRKIAVRCAERLLPSTLELSGCDALIVRNDADLALTARAAWYGITLNRGQTCIAVRRIFVPESLQSAFEEQLQKAAVDRSELPLVMPGQVKQAKDLVDEALSNGAKLLFPEKPVYSLEPSRMPAVILSHVEPSMRLCREATFAPIAGIIAYRDEAELMAKMANCPFALGCSIFSENVEEVRKLALRLAPGLVIINDVLVAAAHPATPFGGRNDSGWGSTQGSEGLLGMTVPQVVSVRTGKFRPHYAPANGGIDAGTERMLNGLLQWKHGATFGRKLKGIWNTIW